MLSKLYKVAAGAAMSALFFATAGVTPLLAQDISNRTVTAVVQPQGDWLELKPNELQWYQVNYDFTTADDEATSEVTVALEMGEEDSVGFHVYTAEQLATWRNGTEIDPMGVGSPKSGQSADLPETKLIWSSGSHGNETFYVIVGNKRADAASYYNIEISGSGISFPVGASIVPVPTTTDEGAEAATGGDATTSADAAPAPDVMNVARGQLFAIGTPVGAWKSLGPRQLDWYQIDYKSIERDHETVSEAAITLEIDTPDSLKLAVYTPAEVQEWIDGEEIDPIGEGAVPSDWDEDQPETVLTWHNATSSAETFYIVVSNDDNVPHNYLLTISGDGVTFPMGSRKIQATAVAPATASAGSATDSSVAAAEAPADDGSSRATAKLVPTGAWEEVGPRQFDWYQLNYQFIKDDGETVSEAYIELEMGDEGSVKLEIFTPAEVQQWINGEEVEAIGAGTPPSNWDEDLPETVLTWNNSTAGDQIFYVVVTNLRDVPSYYNLTIEGNGVSFPMGDLAPIAPQ